MLTDSTSEHPSDQMEQQASESNVCYMQFNVDNICYVCLIDSDADPYNANRSRWKTFAVVTSC